MKNKEMNYYYTYTNHKYHRVLQHKTPRPSRLGGWVGTEIAGSLYQYVFAALPIAAVLHLPSTLHSDQPCPT